MASNTFALLDQAEEDNIHKPRLLAIETKPFYRISGRLLQPLSLINQRPSHLPTPPPDGEAVDEAAAAKQIEREKLAEQHKSWREECLLDFATFEGSVVRIQLLHNSNELERARYAAEKIKIQETAQKVRENTAELRIQLEEAQRTLALRKTYDQLADKILSNRMLKPREDQHVQLEKLNGEIAELEREREQYAETWAERRDQFKRIVDEGKNMLSIIRDEKAEAERKEGMEGGEDGEDVEGSDNRGEASRLGTPRPDGGATPKHRPNERGDGASQLTVPKDRHGAPGSPSKLGSRDTSPAGRESNRGIISETQDTEMQDQGHASDQQTNSDGEIEEGEERSEEEGESMETE